MMRVRKLLGSIGLIFGIIMIATTGLAANPLDATVTINVATSLTITQASINFGSFAGFTSGPQTPVTLNVNAKCNKRVGYKVYIKGATANFASTDGDPTTFPLTLMEYKPTASGTYSAMTTSDQLVHNATAKTSVAGDDLSVPVRLNLLGSEAAGTYTNTVTFTIVAN